MPFVFDENASGISGYSSAQIEQARTSSPNLIGVPTVTQVADDEIIAFPVTGGGNAPESTTDKQVGELKKTLDARVEPDNSLVRDEALVLALKYPGDLTIDQITSICSYLKNGDASIKGWGYVRDPRGLDYFSYANQTLRDGERANCVGGGDCDDYAILMAALIESVGGTTRIILARNSTTGGHAYTEVYLGNLNDKNNQVDEIIDWLKQKFDTDKIYTHIDTNTKNVWLNLDWGPDERGNTHPGGPFYQGDKHIVLRIRDSFVKTPLKLPEISNNSPRLVSLTSDKSPPQNAGTAVNWTAEAKDPENDEMLYQFFLNNEPATKWIEENKWTWTSKEYDIGDNQIEVRVRDGKHAGPDGFDSNKATSFAVQAPETSPIQTTTITKPGRSATISATDPELSITRENGIELNKLIHDGPVYSVSFSPDGSKLATASCDNTARIWDVETGMELHRLTQENCVRSISFSPDGSKLATGSDDSTARIWDVANWKELQKFTDGDMIVSVSFSPDGSKLATGAFNYFVCIWDAESGAKLKKLTYDKTKITSASFSPDGNILAICCSGMIRVIDASSGSELYKLIDAGFRSMQSASFSPDGSKLAVGGHDDNYNSVIIVWDVASRTVLHRLHYKGDMLNNPISFSPDGNMLASGSDDGIVHIWDVASAKEIQEFKQDGMVTSVDFSPDGSKLATGSYDKNANGKCINDHGTAHIWDLVMKHNQTALERSEEAILVNQLQQEVVFSDPNLEAVIRENIGKSEGIIYTADLNGLCSLEAKEKNISNIAGLEYCNNLEYLNLISNQISDVSPLSELSKLKTLYLDQNNQIYDISPLAGLTNLEDLSLFVNKVTNVSPLAGLMKLRKLNLRFNRINDISPLAGLTNLEYLYLENNPITDMSKLSRLTKLKVLTK